jgi:hypothetical protein
MFAACAIGAGDDDDLRDPLGSAQRLTIVPAESAASVHATIRRADGVHAGEAQLAVRDGHLVVHVDRGPDDDDRLVIDELRLRYRDIVLPEAYFHDGQVLTGITVRLERPLALPASRATDGARWASATADLQLDWDLTVDGQAHGLAPQTLPALGLEPIVSDDAGALRADLGISHPGVVWTWAEDVITLGQPHAQLTATTGID